jgi:hypothetical protein
MSIVEDLLVGFSQALPRDTSSTVEHLLVQSRPAIS